jgi:hypothetical protein
MGATINGGGDQLARGATRVQFRNASGVSEEKYNEATQDFDLEKFLGKKPSGSADSKSTGDVVEVPKKSRARKNAE